MGTFFFLLLSFHRKENVHLENNLMSQLFSHLEFGEKTKQQQQQKIRKNKSMEGPPLPVPPLSLCSLCPIPITNWSEAGPQPTALCLPPQQWHATPQR